MENTVVSPVVQPKVPAVSGIRTFVALFFLAWLALIFVLGARGAFVAPPGAPPLALLIGLLAPLGLFLVGYRTIPSLREFVLTADLRIIVGIQAWRWAGFGFLTSVHLRNFAWNFRLACGVGRYGDRCDCSISVVRSPAPARFCGG
jgi:hypothetical protein